MNFKLRQLAAALALVPSFGAFAADYNVGTLTPTPIAGVNQVANSFADRILFTVAAPNHLVGSNVANLPVSFGFFDIRNISGLSVSLFDSSGTSFSSLVSPSGSNAYTATGYLGSGNYEMRISGTGIGMGGAGGYSYAMMAVVPEPQTWAMLLAGLGLLGSSIARRRRG